VGWSTIQPTITVDLGGVYSLEKLSVRSANESSLFNDVAVFGQASVAFSLDGSTYFNPFNYFTPDADRTGGASRWVDVPLGDEFARYVQVQLFDGVKVGEGPKPWIFISGVQVVGVPEPGVAALLVAGAACCWPGRKRWRRR
jgi:hypothetical protein